ncbi:FAD-dependent oxidoreductase [uncultured Amnibacterium sp.]|uniref:FAD-dependent oxidoreductase n=1 Tax=uncultured Amnibacterium sp. TaxID=1631851 RepID=UPI0035CC31C0
MCIVGTGPAGATLAAELSGSGLRVTLLESGDVDRRHENDGLNEVENVGRPRQPDQWEVRNRILGGSSHTWGGRCAPFDDIDFDRRPWVPLSGWPVGPDDLAPYLDRAAPHLGLAMGTGFTDDRFWRIAGRTPPPSQPDPTQVLPFFWQYSRDDAESYPYEYIRFGRNLVARLGPNVTLVTGATVVEIETNGDARVVRGVIVAAPNGRRTTVAARTVVLCAGGIENARILLLSDSVAPNGLGNDRGLVGRHLMDHPRGSIGSFDINGSAAVQQRLGRFTARGHLFRAGYRLSPELQRSEELLNCSAWLGEVIAPDDPWSALRSVVRGGPDRVRGVGALMRNAPLLARGVKQHFVERNGVPRKLQALTLDCMVEQRPDPDSRVTLSKRRDQFGVRIPRIDWRKHPEESRTMRRMATALEAGLTGLGLPAPTLPDWIRDGAEMPTSFTDVAHPTGTTRMSDDPATGVVDRHGAVHGVAGLYVAGSSVFPTSGHSNPTQMIVAMAVRLADRLREQAADRRPLTVQQEQEQEHRTVLLTGATGRIGGVVLTELLDRGYRVRATTSRELPQGRAGVEWRAFDLLTATEHEFDELVAGCDAVLHLAAEIGRMEVMPRVNTDATRLLAEAAERAGVAAFCYTSSVSVYGSGRTRTMAEDAPVLTADHDERSEYWALDYVRAYGRTKLAGELAIHAQARSTRYVILRPAVVVDVAQIVAIRDWNPIKRVLAAHRHAHHVYVRDVADVLIWGMERGLAGIGDPGAVETFNVAEDEFPEPTHAEFLRRAFAASGDPRFRVPRVPGIADWAHDFIRFRSLPLRNPLWRMRFPSDRLHAAGYRLRFGMAHANGLALRDISASTQGSDSGRH